VANTQGTRAVVCGSRWGGGQAQQQTYIAKKCAALPEIQDADPESDNEGVGAHWGSTIFQSPEPNDPAARQLTRAKTHDHGEAGRGGWFRLSQGGRRVQRRPAASGA